MCVGLLHSCVVQTHLYDLYLQHFDWLYKIEKWIALESLRTIHLVSFPPSVWSQPSGGYETCSLLGCANLKPFQNAFSNNFFTTLPAPHSYDCAIPLEDGKDVPCHNQGENTSQGALGVWDHTEMWKWDKVNRSWGFQGNSLLYFIQTT
jgi:hypothetical protein